MTHVELFPNEEDIELEPPEESLSEEEEESGRHNEYDSRGPRPTHQRRLAQHAQACSMIAPVTGESETISSVSSPALTSSSSTSAISGLGPSISSAMVTQPHQSLLSIDEEITPCVVQGRCDSLEASVLGDGKDSAGMALEAVTGDVDRELIDPWPADPQYEVR